MKHEVFCRVEHLVAWCLNWILDRLLPNRLTSRNEKEVHEEQRKCLEGSSAVQLINCLDMVACKKDESDKQTSDKHLLSFALFKFVVRLCPATCSSVLFNRLVSSKQLEGD